MLRKLNLKLGNKLQFNCDLGFNTFRHLTLATRETPWKCLEIAKRNMEIQENILSHFPPEAMIEHARTETMI
jgi:hypothetical protein